MVNFFPNSISEALTLLSENNVQIISGGTDLMVKYRSSQGVLPAFDRPLLFTARIKDMGGISVSDGEIKIGAAVRLSELLDSAEIPLFLKEIIINMASRGIRNEATLAGNIANASPAGDTLPFLYLADALVILQSSSGSRRIPVCDFITGPGRTVINGKELITSVTFRKPDITDFLYRKTEGRKADAISKVTFSGYYSSKDGRLNDVRIAFGAAAPTVVRDRKLENRLAAAINKDSISEIDGIWNEYDRLIHPITDQRSTALYRRKCASNLFNQFVKSIITDG